MNYFRFYEFFNNLMGLPLTFTNNTQDRSRKIILLQIYQRSTELFVLFGVMGQFFAVPMIWADMNILCGCLASGTHSFQVLMKSIILNYYKNDFTTYFEIIAMIKKDINEFELKYFNREGYFIKYCITQSKYVRLVLITHFTITFCSTSAYFIPFVYDSVVNYDTVKRQLTPIVVYFPVDFNWTPLFQIIVLLLTICFYLNNLKTVVIDNIILGLVVLNMSMFRYHNSLLGSIMDKYDVDRVQHLTDSSASLTLHKKLVLREWVILLQTLLMAASRFGKLLSPYLLIEFLYVLVHTCVPAFVITSTFSWTMAQKIAVLFIVLGGLIQLLLMSIAGDSFTEAWANTGNDLFQSNLLRKEEKWRFGIFKMTQTRLNCPFYLSAFGLYPLKGATFIAISRLIASHYMTLNQIQTLKNGKP